MDEKTVNGATADQSAPTISNDQLRKEGAEAATSRIKGITAKGKEMNTPSLANHLAFNTTIAPEECAEIMATAKEDFPVASNQTSKEQQPANAEQYYAEKQEDSVLGMALPETQKSSKSGFDWDEHLAN